MASAPFGEMSCSATLAARYETRKVGATVLIPDWRQLESLCKIVNVDLQDAAKRIYIETLT